MARLITWTLSISQVSGTTGVSTDKVAMFKGGYRGPIIPPRKLNSRVTVTRELCLRDVGKLRPTKTTAGRGAPGNRASPSRRREPDEKFLPHATDLVLQDLDLFQCTREKVPEFGP